MNIHYGTHNTPFGECLIATTNRGLCHLAFTLGQANHALVRLQTDWPDADLIEDSAITEPLVKAVFATEGFSASLEVDLRGTPFQIKVWMALRAIPRGHVTTYGTLAAVIGHPKASRAVGTAVGDNPVAVVVPCHRVVRKDGSIGGYYYGPDLKSALLRWEGALR
jgi:AraC family transcriptional regulator of adaptative response/methylated-DNA-[protein]-cysteine methyltransferase